MAESGADANHVGRIDQITQLPGVRSRATNELRAARCDRRSALGRGGNDHETRAAAKRSLPGEPRGAWHTRPAADDQRPPRLPFVRAAWPRLQTL